MLCFITFLFRNLWKKSFLVGVKFFIGGLLLVTTTAKVLRGLPPYEDGEFWYFPFYGIPKEGCASGCRFPLRGFILSFSAQKYCEGFLFL